MLTSLAIFFYALPLFIYQKQNGLYTTLYKNSQSEKWLSLRKSWELAKDFELLFVKMNFLKDFFLSAAISSLLSLIYFQFHFMHSSRILINIHFIVCPDRRGVENLPFDSSVIDAPSKKLHHRCLPIAQSRFYNFHCKEYLSPRALHFKTKIT